MAIGESISKYRKELCMTQQQLADSLCVSRDLVSKWEHGDRRPDYPTVIKLGQLFNVQPESLIDYENAVLAEFQNYFPENVEKDQLIICINTFLSELEEKDRIIFVMRYYMFLDIKTISHRMGIRDSNIRKKLSRTRTKLKSYLMGGIK